MSPSLCLLGSFAIPEQPWIAVSARPSIVGVTPSDFEHSSPQSTELSNHGIDPDQRRLGLSKGLLLA